MYQQRNEVHNNCGIEIYYQTDMQTTRENMLLELFCQIISEPCFNTLRTKEQLGERRAEPATATEANGAKKTKRGIEKKK